uniref:DNA-directed RNA polymerase n=1 Tax=Xenopsylla cheopis TaxID=163159 RepID=A0A6M2DMP6_XENCH
MYRLFRVKLLSQNYVQKLSRKNYTNAQIRETCSCCNQNSCYVPNSYLTQNRCNSTTSTQSLKTVIKRKRKSRKKNLFSELLEVNEDKTSTKKASIKKLKPKDLARIISQPDVSLGELYKLQNNFLENEQSSKNNVHFSTLSFSKNQRKSNLEVLDSFEDLPVCFLTDNMTVNTSSVSLLYEIRENYHEFSPLSMLEEYDLATQSELESLDELSIEDKLVHENFIGELEVQTESQTDNLVKQDQITSPNSKKRRMSSEEKALQNKIIKEKMELMDRAAKEDGLQRSLTAFLDLCITNNLLNRGLATLLHYRNRGKKKLGLKVVDLNLYNIMIKGFSKRGNYAKVYELLTCLREDKIPWSVQTFAHIFECLGRNPSCPENDRLLAKYRSEAISKGFSLNDVVDKSKFTNDEREVVISAIQRLEPEFKPVYTPPILHYTGELVEYLNTNRPPIENLNRTENLEGDLDKDFFSAKKLRIWSQEQLNLEVNGIVAVKSIEKLPEPDEFVLHCRQKFDEIQSVWKQKICEAFKRDLQALRAQHSSVKSHRAISIYPYLRVLKISDYADIVLRESRRVAEGSETYSPTVNQLYKELGLRVQSRYHIEVKQANGILDKINEIYGEYCFQISETYKRLQNIDYSISEVHSLNKLSDFNTRQKWQMLIYLKNHGSSTDVEEINWPLSVLLAVGKFLYNILMRDLKIDVKCMKMNNKQQNTLPAFYTLFRSQGKFVKEEVKPHPILSKLLRNSGQEYLYFEPNTVPMLCPPVPWTSITSGGYLVARTDLVRLPYYAVQQWQRMANTPLPELYPSIDSLNQLGAVPWKINTQVLDVILEVFNSGGSDKLDVPRPSTSLKLPAIVNFEELSKQDKFNIYRQRLAVKRKQGEMYSLWCEALYRLSLANHFRNKIFWLPHNMDFRGRVYPCPPHLNHLGSDLARSMLIFGMGKPLGADGLNWLKIHCINLTGLLKHDSINKRLNYANKILDDILDSADKPLTGKQWWAQSDEPWQTLATCMEIAKAIRSPDPEKYISHFPVHQDGSCNGLQHYAALGRDAAGAYSVNLMPEDKPQDVYSAVAKLVEKTRAKDAENNNKIAKILEGYVKRKVIKQTVMTTVYGVTRFGARLQIARQLKDIEDFPKDHIWTASSYLTNKTFESLREMFTSTKEIQDWFTECARLISAVCGQNVEWVTPLGLPIVQPYHRSTKTVDISNNKITDNAALDLFERPNVMKQKNAFPPNFIHSLDSSHMMLTSLHCEHAGITFVSVHDCFWTHPCTIPVMNKVCREQFVALHSQPILEELSKYLMKKYSYPNKDFKNDGSVIEQTKKKLNKVLRRLPARGEFELNNVLKSTYFFS